MPYIDLGQVVGPKGPQGEVGPQGPQGIQGEHGNTPQKGVDYFTESDILEVANKAADLVPLEDHTQDKNNPHGLTAAQVGARAADWMPTVDEIGAAPASESADYPGCYYRIVDGVTEWLNPPMVIGEEYRTTQRWEGKPVYRKTVNFGALPNNTYASASVSAISREKVLSIHGFMANDSGESRPIPYATTYSAPLKGAVDLLARTTGTASIAVVVSTDFDASGWTAMLILRYTKSTD